MRYSCFNPTLGLYDYYADAKNHPINGDLPIPKFPKPTQLGVAAIEAGRPLPSAARYVGQGWHAQGQIVQCNNGALGEQSYALSWIMDGGWAWIAGGVAAVLILRKVL